MTGKPAFLRIKLVARNGRPEALGQMDPDLVHPARYRPAFNKGIGTEEGLSIVVKVVCARSCRSGDLHGTVVLLQDGRIYQLVFEIVDAVGNGMIDLYVTSRSSEFGWKECR